MEPHFIAPKDYITRLVHEKIIELDKKSVGKDVETTIYNSGIYSWIVPTSLFVGLRLVDTAPFNDFGNRTDIVKLPFNNTTEGSVIEYQKYGPDRVIGGIPRLNGTIGAAQRKLDDFINGEKKMFFQNYPNNGELTYKHYSMKDINDDSFWQFMVYILKEHCKNIKGNCEILQNHLDLITNKDYYKKLKSALFTPIYEKYNHLEEKIYFQPVVCAYGGGVKRVAATFDYACKLIEIDKGVSYDTVSFYNMFNDEYKTYDKNDTKNSDKIVGLEYRKDGSHYPIRLSITDMTPNVKFYNV